MLCSICTNWARDASDVVEEHHPNCPAHPANRKDPATCQHEDFSATVNVSRITDQGGKVARYMADTRVCCAHCGTPFRFVGLPAGHDFDSPCVSVDATEGRFPIAPKGEVLSELEGTPIGFTIRKTK